MQRILVVDDDRMVQGIIKAILEQSGRAVIVVADGRQALDELERARYDLVIVDIYMPGMDGFEIIRAIRRSRWELPIIVISGTGPPSIGEAGPDFLGMAVKLGASRSLRKPFRAGELLAAVEACGADAGMPMAHCGQIEPTT